jgi:NAD+ synthase (glutamine-hydrolysing)
MNLVHVGAAVLNTIPLDWDHNLSLAKAAIAEARARGVQILCLPELCLTGYGCEDAFHSIGVQDAAWRSLLSLLPDTAGMAVCVGVPILHCNGLYNTAALLVDGHIAGFYAKQFLAGDGIHYEPRWFKAWPTGVRALLNKDGNSYPIGDLFVNVGGIRIGFEICEDAWVANRPGANLAKCGVDVILNPSASHFAFGKIDVRRRFVAEGSRAFGCTYVYANLVGNEAGRAIYDGGALIASCGGLLAQGVRLTFHDFLVTDAVVDTDATRVRQARTTSFQPDVSSGAFAVDAPFAWKTVEPTHVNAAELQAWETGECRKEEEFARAEALALFDYLRKSRANGFVVSLSGGADSAAVVTLIRLAVDLSIAEIGAEGVCAKLGYLPDLPTDPDRLTARLLTCAYQGTKNSGQVTRIAAQTVAEAIGAKFHSWDIDTLVSGYTDLIAKAVGRNLTWENDDIALQNIQARTRSPGIWLLANLTGSLLLATSNRSEAAVGYATMDGDTSGGLSPIAGIDKAFLRSWLTWMGTVGPQGRGPLPALRVITEQHSTPELRPQEAHQESEDDLMPFPLLDAIERAGIRDKLMPVEIFRLLRPRFLEYGNRQLATWVRRFFTLWCRNQWKRERYAPCFHLDDENLDPKTWCRFPILSGGFTRELEELDEYVARIDPSVLDAGNQPEGHV